MNSNILSSYKFFVQSQQPQSSESTLERVSNKQAKGNTPQPQSFVNTNTPANNTAKVMNSYELESIRGSQQISPAPQAQSRDVTRVVKILKQNEPLVRVLYLH